MRFGRVRRLAFRTISQIGIRYRASALSETLPGLPEGAPRAGDRFPWMRLRFSPNGPAEDIFGRLDDTRFALIRIGQPASAGGVSEMDDRLRVHFVPPGADNDRELARVGIPPQAFYLVRPDGYVGLAGIRFEPGAASRYVSERLRMKRSLQRRSA